MSLNVIACTGERNNLSIFRYGGIHYAEHSATSPITLRLLAPLAGSGIPLFKNREEVDTVYELKTMVVLSRPHFGHVGSGQGPERAFWA